MKRWAMLLKGVNVGGNRKLPVAELRAFLEALGLGEVRTLLASGNAVFASEEKGAAELEAWLEEEAHAKLGLSTDILLRDRKEIDAIVAANPFPDAAKARPNHLLVTFHRDPFPADLIATLRESYDGPERLAAVGRELFVDFPDGIGDSKLHPATARAKFPKIATGRNWNTLLKLQTMLTD